MSELTHNACMYCRSKDGEDTTNFIIVEGIVSTFRFHPQRLEEQRELVTAILNELPAAFKVKESFLKIRFTKNGELWTGRYIICEELVGMAIGLDLMEYHYSRELWKLLPDEAPLLTYKVEFVMGILTLIYCTILPVHLVTILYFLLFC